MTTTQTTGRTGTRSSATADPTTRSLVHAALHRDLDDFVAAAAATPLHDRWTWGRLQARWTLFTELLEHHRAADSDAWPLDPLLDSCRAGFGRLTRTGDHDARAALVVRLTAAREGLNRQLAQEEAGATPTPHPVQDWAALDARDPGASGLTRRAARALLPWALYGLDDEQAQRVLGDAPRALILSWRVTRRGFAREQRRDFRYAG
jgi:hypothetical protein